KFGEFLPNAPVTDLQFNEPFDILAASTNGRGAWEILLQPSEVSGHVFFDHDGDGHQDLGDEGLGGATVYLDVNGDGVRNSLEPSALSNAQGDYSLHNVPPGVFTLRQTPPNGYTPTTGPFENLTLGGSNIPGLNFGDKVGSFQAAPCGCITPTPPSSDQPVYKTLADLDLMPGR